MGKEHAGIEQTFIRYPICGSSVLGSWDKAVKSAAPVLLELTFLVRMGRYSTREKGKMSSYQMRKGFWRKIKQEGGIRDHGKIGTLSTMRGGLTEVTLELSPKEGVMWAFGEVF